MYKAIIRAEELKPDPEKPYALDCWHYSNITFRKRPQVKAMLSRAMGSHYYRGANAQPMLSQIRIFKLMLDNKYHLIFDDKSQLGEAYRNGAVTEEELKNFIEW